MHLDYPNHTLTHPPAWDQPEAVEIIIYLCNESDVGGATAVVPRDSHDDVAYNSPMVNTPGTSDIPWINDRLKPKLGFRSIIPRSQSSATYDRGCMPNIVRDQYCYRHDTWHRGTPLRPGFVRLAHNLTFRKEASWISTLHPGWAWAMYKPDQRMERLIAWRP